MKIVDSLFLEVYVNNLWLDILMILRKKLRHIMI